MSHLSPITYHPSLSSLRPLIAAAAVCIAFAACSPQMQLLAALTPDGTVSMLLGHLERVSDVNRKRVAELERAGRWDDLAQLAQQNLAQDPRNADWWLVLGYARSQAQDHSAAAKAYNEVVRLEPDNASGWNLLAQSHRAAGDSRRALGVLDNALLALRDAPVTVYLLGETYTDLGRFNEALEAYQKVLVMEPRFPAAWFGLARTYERLGRTDEARQARARLEKLDPQLAQRLGATGAPEAAGAR
jgi:tetratricopeptide (TPR) repeat protein